MFAPESFEERHHALPHVAAVAAAAAAMVTGREGREGSAVHGVSPLDL